MKERDKGEPEIQAFDIKLQSRLFLLFVRPCIIDTQTDRQTDRQFFVCRYRSRNMSNTNVTANTIEQKRSMIDG